MKSFRTLVITLALFALPLIAVAQGKPSKPTPSPTPIPPTIEAKFNFCAAGDTACETANRVRQDIDRSYKSGSEGVSIQNATGTSGEIIVSLQNSTRSVVYDLRDRVSMGNPQPSWTSTPQNFKVHFFLHNANAVKTTGECATSFVCEANLTSAMNGGFYIGKVRYVFQWNPTSMMQFVNWVEPTSNVNINYKRDATGQTFTITPMQNARYYYLAGMQVEDRNFVSFGGQYNMPFSFVITVK